MKKTNLIAASVLLFTLLSAGAYSVFAQDAKLNVPKKADLPLPQLEWQKFDADVKGSDGKPYFGIGFGITNWQSFAAALFAAAPDLPACGLNKNSSRSWLDIFDAASGKRIYGFCAFSKSEQMKTLSFYVKRENLPKCIYVALTDRQTKKTVKSNSIETTSGDDARCQKPKPKTKID